MSAHPSTIKNRQASAPLQRTWRDELGLIRRAALVFCAATLAAMLAVGTSIWFLDEQHDTLAHAQQVREAAAARLRNVEIEKAEIRVYQPRFVQLKAQGLIGEERRLEWTESIRQIQAARRMLPVAFEIEPQQLVAMASPLAIGEYQLRGSRMNVHLDLLHEGDLFDFLSDLRRRHFFTVQDCKITRSSAPQEGVITARLLADCTLNWITLAPTEQVVLPVAPAARGWP